MTERLIIQGFAGIDHLSIDLSDLNILIGAQATGKSVCAKLLYHFKGFIADIFTAVENQRTRQELDEAFCEDFRRLFPPDSWGPRPFVIRYGIADATIELTRRRSGRPDIWLKYSECYTDHLRWAQENLAKVPLEPVLRSWFEVADVRNQLLGTAKVRLGPPAGFEQVFIPAGRAFFAVLQQTIFSILAGRNDLDPTLVEFGRFYKGVRRHSMDDGAAWAQADEGLRSRLNRMMASILGGRHENEKGEDYLKLPDGRRTSIAYASSGQQEALPLAVILLQIPFRLLANWGLTIYIEEPEAHLFPTSQRVMVELIATVFNTAKVPVQFIITTHSPYILTALNNLLQAGSLEKQISQERRAKVYDIVPREQTLDPDVVRVYSLDSGGAQSICCQDTGLIDTNVIDDVSNELSIQFGELLEIE